MTLAELLTIRNSLPKDATEGSMETRYKMAKLIRATAADFDFYVDQYKKILLSCAARGEDGQIISGGDGGISVSKEKAEEFSNRVKELDGTVVKVPDYTFTLVELEPFGLSVEALMSLDPIIQD